MSFQGRKNVYTCQTCGNHITTVDRDDGTTPFSLRCRAHGGDPTPDSCPGVMYSAFYRLPDGWAEAVPPAWEWYRPDEDEYATLDAASRQHVDMGGLLIRRMREAP